jgi:hypothetical protein
MEKMVTDTAIKITIIPRIIITVFHICIYSLLLNDKQYWVLALLADLLDPLSYGFSITSLSGGQTEFIVPPDKGFTLKGFRGFTILFYFL